MKQRLYDLLRPLYWPVTSFLRRRLGRGYYRHPEMELPPAYDAVQLEVERRLHHYLHCAPTDVSHIVIVGAHTTDEIPRIRHSYPNVRFTCVEPSPKSLPILREKWGHDPNVEIIPVAASDHTGNEIFYELDLPGNGSLLEPDTARWSRYYGHATSDAQEVEVQVDMLDNLLQEDLDLLWIDVQGAEMRVLQGATGLLRRTKAVFLEMTLLPSPYRGGTPFRDVDGLLVSSGLVCVGLGIDPWNFTGVGLFVSNVDGLVCKDYPTKG